jgi:hypothetical protein
MRNPIASLIDDGRLFHMPMVVPTTSATAGRYREISLGLATSDAVTIWVAPRKLVHNSAPLVRSRCSSREGC